ncbi:MAG: hypothetical protein ACLPSH_13520 [Vulcanimicrobiaceae bacterium]
MRNATVPAFHVCGLPGGVRPLATSDPGPWLLLGLISGALALLCAAVVARRPVGAGLLNHVAELPLATSALFVAAMCAVGVSVFDASMALHGPVTDVYRHQYCWLSGLLASAGALLTIGVGVVARSLRKSLEKITEFVVLALRLGLAMPAARPKLSRRIGPPLPASFHAIESFGSRAPPSFS